MGNNICSDLSEDKDQSIQIAMPLYESTGLDQDQLPVNLFLGKESEPVEASKRKMFQTQILQPQLKQTNIKTIVQEVKEKSIKEASIDNQIQRVTLTELISCMELKNRRTQKIKIDYGAFICLRNQDIKKKYRFEEKIGEGAYGRVYKATVVKTNEIVAIKIIRKDHISRYWEEIQILKLCDHPNIIHLYEIYEDQFQYYVIMEYCEGGSAAKFFLNKKQVFQITDKFLRQITLQVLQSLAYLHERNIIHGDIKLENIVFLNSDQKGVIDIEIIDFGMAKKCSYKVNKFDKPRGTISYMPPQAFQGWFSPASDIWSCGVMLYLIVCGQNPFKGGSKIKMIQNIKNKEVNFREEIWESINPNFQSLIAGMLNKNFKKRPSAKECLQNIWLNQSLNKSRKSRKKRASIELAQNLSKYHAENNFVSVIQSYLSFLKITQKERQEMMELFQLLDEGKNGTLSLIDIKRAYRTNDKVYANSEIEQIMKKVDKNNSGEIDFSEFLIFMYGRKKLFVKESLAEAFDYFDRDHSGFIQIQELLSLLNQCSDEYQELLNKIDVNKDMKISKQEFLTYFEHIKNE